MSVRSEDPVLRSARREAAATLIAWACALSYTVIYCSLYGYGRSLDDLHFVLGFPDWVFWGIVAPWGVCMVLCYWFSYVFMTDEDLGGEGGQGVARAEDEAAGGDHA
jgi:hypothetical protein